MRIKNGVVSGTDVLGVLAPTLTELKSRACTQKELQSALVQLIEMVNFNAGQSDKNIRAVADIEWRATI